MKRDVFYWKSRRIYRSCFETVKERLVFFFLAVAFSQIALPTYSQKISLSENNVEIQKIFKKIHKQAGYLFLYNNELLKEAKKVTIKTKEASIEDILEICFEGQPITYELIRNTIIVKLKKDDLQDAEPFMELKGKVTDEKGAALYGVTIRRIGTDNGTVTDEKGEFSLHVGRNSTIEVSFLSYQKETIELVGKNYLEIIMKPSLENLEEIVVVGYNTQRRSSVTGAVSSLNMKHIEDNVVTGIEHALEGRMPGVTVLQNSGAPGASASVRIRGLGTLGNNEPLYIVDGVPVSGLNDIDPNTIERIDVHKDAAASAIYGSRAGNGVVIIQTKRGRSSEKISITLNSQQGFQKTTGKIDVLNAEERNLIHSRAYTNSGLEIPGYYSSPSAQISQTIWQDEIFMNSSYISSYNIGVNGGSNAAKVNVMAGHFDNQGILRNSNFDRTTFNVNTELKVSDKLKIGETLMLGTNKSKQLNTVNEYTGALYTALLYQPDIPVYTTDGALSGVGNLGGDLENPVGILKRSDDVYKRYRFLGNAFVEWSIVKKLTFRTDFGYDFTYAENKRFISKVPEAGRQTSYNELNQVTHKVPHWISTSTLKYDGIFDKHSILALVGFSREESSDTYEIGTASDFISEDRKSRNFSSARNIKSLQGGLQEWSLLSYFGHVDYSLANKYLASLNLRLDGSSKFAKGNRWGLFPSFSLGWKVSDEDFFSSLKKDISSLKLRGSWGQLGNQNIFDNYPTYLIYTNTIDNDGYYAVFGPDELAMAGRYGSNLPNSKIKWEVTTHWNTGVNIGLFRNAVEIVVDYFNKKTSKVLLQVPITSLAGVNASWENTGMVENRGWETSINYNFKIGQFKFDVSANGSFLKNKIIKLGGDHQAIYGAGFRGNSLIRTTTGQPMGYFYGLKTDGLFQSEEEIEAYVNQEGKKLQPYAVPGDIKFIDLNHDGILDANDRTNIGSGFPKLSYGFTLNSRYKNFDLMLFFNGVGGARILNATKWTGMFVDPHYNQFASILDSWTPTNRDTKVPRVSVDDPNGNQQISDFYVESGNYLRLRNITLGYTILKLPFDLKSNLRIYFTSQNLFRLTKYKGIDPELGETFPGNYGISEIGVDRGQYPPAKTFLVGFNFSL